MITLLLLLSLLSASSSAGGNLSVDLRTLHLLRTDLIPSHIVYLLKMNLRAFWYKALAQGIKVLDQGFRAILPRIGVGMKLSPVLSTCSLGLVRL